MVISSQKSNRTMYLLMKVKLCLRASQMGTRMSSFQIMTELLYPSLWFFSQTRSPVRKIENSPPYSNSSSKFPVMIMSRSMQNFRPLIPWSLKRVTFPHHFFQPSSKGIGLIPSCKSFGSSVKQQKSMSQLVFLLIPAQSLLTQEAGYRVPHFTDSTLIFFSPSYLAFCQFWIRKALKPWYSGSYFLVACTICSHVLFMASSFRPSCLKMSVKLITDSWLSGCISNAFWQQEKAFSISSVWMCMTARLLWASIQATSLLSFGEQMMVEYFWESRTPFEGSLISELAGLYGERSMTFSQHLMA